MRYGIYRTSDLDNKPCKNDKYRKPNVGMLDLLCENYVGDDLNISKVSL